MTSNNFSIKKEKARKLRTNGFSYPYIANELKVSEGSAYKWTKDIKLSNEQIFNIHSNKSIKYVYNEKLFENENSKIYYLLGAFITDGNVGKDSSLSITSIDEEWIINLAKLFSPNKNIKKGNITTAGNQAYVFTSYNRKITNWFLSKNCNPRKTFTVELPVIPDLYFWDFMRGVIDGDGSFSMKIESKKRPNYFSPIVQLVSASKLFTESIYQKLITNNINCKLFISHNKVKKNPYYRIVIKGINAVKLCELIYSNNEICLQRKYNLYLKYKLWRTEYETNNARALIKYYS